MKIFIKTFNPKSHLEVCSMIRFYGSQIEDSEICQGNDELYGYFVLITDPESIDSFILLPDVLVGWE